MNNSTDSGFQQDTKDCQHWFMKITKGTTILEKCGYCGLIKK